MRGGYVDVESLPAEAEIEAEGSEMTSQLVILALVLPMSGSEDTCNTPTVQSRRFEPF
jgi:hypothetical protein